MYGIGIYKESLQSFPKTRVEESYANRVSLIPTDTNHSNRYIIDFDRLIYKIYMFAIK